MGMLHGVQLIGSLSLLYGYLVRSRWAGRMSWILRFWDPNPVPATKSESPAAFSLLAIFFGARRRVRLAA